MKTEKFSLNNSAIFKAKDLKLVDRVRSFFEENEISSEIVGGLPKNLIAGNPRAYGNIDLRVTPPTDKYNKEFNNYTMAIENLYRLSEKDDPNFRVKNMNNRAPTDIDLDTGYRFQIFSDETRSIVNITFGKYITLREELRVKNDRKNEKLSFYF